METLQMQETLHFKRGRARSTTVPFEPLSDQLSLFSSFRSIYLSRFLPYPQKIRKSFVKKNF